MAMNTNFDKQRDYLKLLKVKTKTCEERQESCTSKIQMNWLIKVNRTYHKTLQKLKDS